MEKLRFSETFNASPEKVWNALWEDANYRKWAAVFHEGSYAESDWKEGSDIRFLGPGGGGMYGIIEKKDDNKFMSFKHMGEVKEFVNQPNDEKSSAWAGAHENYELTEVDGKTRLDIEVDMAPDFAEYFTESFKKALVLIREIAEG